MLYLHAQLQQKLQLDYKTNITQIHQKIELPESLTTKKLKKPHSFRRATLQRQGVKAALPNTQTNTGRLSNCGDKEIWPK